MGAAGPEVVAVVMSESSWEVVAVQLSVSVSVSVSAVPVLEVASQGLVVAVQLSVSVVPVLEAAVQGLAAEVSRWVAEVHRLAETACLAAEVLAGLEAGEVLALALAPAPAPASAPVRAGKGCCRTVSWRCHLRGCSTGQTSQFQPSCSRA